MSILKVPEEKRLSPERWTASFLLDIQCLGELAIIKGKSSHFFCNLNLIEVLPWLFSFVMVKSRSAGVIAEDVVLTLDDMVMGTAIVILQPGQRLL